MIVSRFQITSWLVPTPMNAYSPGWNSPPGPPQYGGHARAGGMFQRWGLVGLGSAALIVLCACASTPTPPTTIPELLPGPTPTLAPAVRNTQTGINTLTLTSPAFVEGSIIPKKYTCDGENISPPLEWSGAPADTSSYSLIVDDPDAPGRTFTHWVAYDISRKTTSVPEGANKVGISGKNGAGKLGYTGPCPPSGTHRYVFTLYALTVPTLGLNEGASRDEVAQRIVGHILAQAQLIGRYGR